MDVEIWDIGLEMRHNLKFIILASFISFGVINFGFKSSFCGTQDIGTTSFKK